MAALVSVVYILFLGALCCVQGWFAVISRYSAPHPPHHSLHSLILFLFFRLPCCRRTKESTTRGQLEESVALAVLLYKNSITRQLGYYDLVTH
uniref:Putative secreted peptide n=1 Tax=Anopheles braziliensis TaxID=58242 RepID=A0A2M3ZV48_9DIPT